MIGIDELKALFQTGDTPIGADFASLIDASYNINGGWLEITDGAWSYASATTITVPSGAANIYAVGDQIRLKQGGGYKYFSVVSVADTTLTVTGGSDYSVANAAITDAAFSKGGGVGHPGWFNWAATWTGFSSAPLTTLARFSINQRICSFFIEPTDAGTSNATSMAASLPIAAAADLPGAPTWAGSNSFAYNNGVWITAGTRWTISEGASIINFFTDMVGGAWTASGEKRAGACGFYEI